MTQTAGSASDQPRVPVENASSPTRDRSSATAPINKQPKRLTLTFPILPPRALGNGDDRRSPSPSDSSRGSPRLVAQPSSPADSSNFLTALAAQERRVLELREELQRAEQDLTALKKQWAALEANKKKRAIRQVQKLQPLPTQELSQAENDTEASTSSTRTSLEQHTTKPTRKPQQRVFSGSRHTRTLSLLSPAVGNEQHHHAQPFEDTKSNMNHDVAPSILESSLNNLATVLNAEERPGFGKTYKNLSNRRSMPPPSTDALVKTGKQIATDFKDGLWTFFEDIRQATVGEEGITGTDSRSGQNAPKSTKGMGRALSERNTSRPRKAALESKNAVGPTSGTKIQGTIKTNGEQKATEPSFWQEFGVETPGRGGHLPLTDVPNDQAQSAGETHAALVDLDDGWDNWDSPAASRKHDLEPPKHADDDSYPLPWPELTKLTPSKLTRTLSDLMRDWDSPYPGQIEGRAAMDEHAFSNPHV